MALNPKLTAIYALSGEDGVVRYVGKSERPSTRQAEHRRAGTIGQGVAISMAILEWTADWETAERRWIEHYRSLGAPLVNIAAGGLDMAHVEAERGKYPAYAWLVRHLSRVGRKEWAADLRKKANGLKREHGAAGMRGFDDHCRALLRELLPFSAGAR